MNRQVEAQPQVCFWQVNAVSVAGFDGLSA